MSLNASGVRDTARVLRISPDPVLRALRQQEAALASVNTARLRTVAPDEMLVDIQQAGEADMEAMGSFGSNQGNQRGLWPAIDHHTGAVLAYVFGRRKDAVFWQRKAFLEPLGLTRFEPDHWGVYTRHLEPDVHRPGKRHRQKIERTPLPLRTRIKRVVRKTICFSKSAQMHDLVLGLLVNLYAFGRAV
jgi:insertion element IS1 protein InsB